MGTLTLEDRRKIELMWRRNVSPAKIAAELEISQCAVYMALKRGQEADGEDSVVLDENFRPAYSIERRNPCTRGTCGTVDAARRGKRNRRRRSRHVYDSAPYLEQLKLNSLHRSASGLYWACLADKRDRRRCPLRPQ